jgi:hypothetical protein
VKQAMALKAEQDAWNKGDYDACRAILAANPSVGYEMKSEPPPVSFTKAALLTNDKDENTVREADFSDEGAGPIAKLMMGKDDSPSACTGDLFKLRISFMFQYEVLDGSWNKNDPDDSSGSRVSLGTGNKFRYPTEREAPSVDNPVRFVQDSSRAGHVDISLKLRNNEALRASITIHLRGSFPSSRISGDSFNAQGIVRILCPNEDPRRH